METGRGLTPIEIKSAKTINPSFFSHLNYWSALALGEKLPGYLIYAGEESQKRSDISVMIWRELPRMKLN